MGETVYEMKAYKKLADLQIIFFVDILTFVSMKIVTVEGILHL